MINNQADSVEPTSGESPAESPAESNTETFSVGTRVLRLRQVFGMSQRRLATLAGVTNGTISMIEQNRVSPSVASLKKILEALGLSLAEFFANGFEPDTRIFYRADEMTRISDAPVLLKQIGGDLRHRRLQMLHERYAAGGDTGPTMLLHDGEEAGIIVRGQIEITVGSQSRVLGPGDGYYFNSRLPHRFRNRGTEECEVVSTCTPPSF